MSVMRYWNLVYIGKIRLMYIAVVMSCNPLSVEEIVGFILYLHTLVIRQNR